MKQKEERSRIKVSPHSVGTPSISSAERVNSCIVSVANLVCTSLECSLGRGRARLLAALMELNYGRGSLLEQRSDKEHWFRCVECTHERVRAAYRPKIVLLVLLLSYMMINLPRQFLTFPGYRVTICVDKVEKERKYLQNYIYLRLESGRCPFEKLNLLWI
ncbi:hypothetical protein HN011_011963 [Eciton burchellii]|nr:hypothetical protein HN011_011963 [Eciton burchellii]